MDMLKNAFIGRTSRPTVADLSAALGSAWATWDQLLVDLRAEHGVDSYEWKCHSPKWGWSLRVLRKKRTIVWLSPAADGFNVTFILGEKAMRAARETKLPARIVQVLDTAPKYPEGSGVRLMVTSSRSLGALKKLAAIKIAN
jgi:hypothetical protein